MPTSSRGSRRSTTASRSSNRGRSTCRWLANCFHYFSGWATKLAGETLPVSPAFFTYTLREPLGVVGAIIPWNFPMIMVGWKAAPALAAGNCVVLKPAELTPLTAIRIGELALEAGLPPGVFNVLPGKGSDRRRGAGRASAVSTRSAFTGSTEVGRAHHDAVPPTRMKKVTLELGGKSPNIVFADADLDAAVRGAANGIFYGKGEVCAAGSRLLVEKRRSTTNSSRSSRSARRRSSPAIRSIPRHGSARW